MQTWSPNSQLLRALAAPQNLNATAPRALKKLGFHLAFIAMLLPQQAVMVIQVRALHAAAGVAD